MKEISSIFKVSGGFSHIWKENQCLPKQTDVSASEPIMGKMLFNQRKRTLWETSCRNQIVRENNWGRPYKIKLIREEN